MMFYFLCLFIDDFIFIWGKCDERLIQTLEEEGLVDNNNENKKVNIDHKVYSFFSEFWTSWIEFFI